MFEYNYCSVLQSNNYGVTVPEHPAQALHIVFGGTRSIWLAILLVVMVTVVVMVVVMVMMIVMEDQHSNERELSRFLLVISIDFKLCVKIALTSKIQSTSGHSMIWQSDTHTDTQKHTHTHTRKHTHIPVPRNAWIWRRNISFSSPCPPPNAHRHRYLSPAERRREINERAPCI
jgi:hypothetical protein